MATKNVTVPASYKGLKAVYITPSEDRLLRKVSHPKGSPQPKKGPGGLLMMEGGEDDRAARWAADPTHWSNKGKAKKSRSKSQSQA